MGKKKRTRTRRIRRTTRQTIKHGRHAKRRHARASGRTGQIAEKRRNGLAWEAAIRKAKELKNGG